MIPTAMQAFGRPAVPPPPGAVLSTVPPPPPARAVPDASKYAALPAAIRDARRWLLWRSIPAAKKPRKVPYYCDGAPRNGRLDTPEDQARLAPFDDAVRALQTGKYTGLGFALGPDGSGGYWQGVDLDNLPEHPELQAVDLPGYTEASPGGNGRHAVGYGRHFDTLGSNTSGIEAYAAGRYFTVTGAGAGGSPECLADFVESRLAPMHGRVSRTVTAPPAPDVFSGAPETISPDALLDLRNALLSMPSEDRSLWVSMGLALKSLGDIGRELWLAWSATCPEKYDEADAMSTWLSFRPERTGYKAVFAEAQRRGWENPRSGGALPQNVFGPLAPVEGWPEPLPIPCSLLPVKPFNSDMLPTALRAWVADIAERVQCPADFLAVGAMVALSSVIGRKACVRPKRQDDWQVIPNLWGAVVGRPGVMKSPALAEVMKPLDRLTVKANELHAGAMLEHELKLKLEGMGGKAAEDKAQKLVKDGKVGEAEQLLRAAANGAADDADAPALRRYKVTDSTVEALQEILIENPWGTLAYRDELHGLLRSLDKPGQEGSRAFYLQSYDGNQGYTVDRLGRGRNRHIEAVCLSMLGGIQPGKLQAHIRDAVDGGAGDDGLLQRFGLLVWPDVIGEWHNVDRWPNTSAKNAAFEAFQRLDALAPGTDSESGKEAPAVYRFTGEAQSLFEKWRQELEASLRAGDLHPAMESHLAKYRKLVPAIALVCALADGEAEVSKDSLLRALAWSEYLKTHAARAYAAGTRPATEGALALLAKIEAGAVEEGFKPADAYLKGWSHLNTPEAVHSAAGMLCDLGYLRRNEKAPGDQGGRPSTTYSINPATRRAL